MIKNQMEQFNWITNQFMVNKIKKLKKEVVVEPLLISLKI